MLLKLLMKSRHFSDKFGKKKWFQYDQMANASL